MKIALLGYGKMGKEIEKISIERGHSISVIIDKDDDVKSLSDSDVAINFSTPSSAVSSIKLALDSSVPIISGTTGWLEKYNEIVEYSKNTGTSFMYASNYSLGVNLFFELNKILTRLLNKHDQYKIALQEIHHTEKIDKPSGTALTLAEDIIKDTDYEDWSFKNNTNKTIKMESVRENNVPGTHKVKYDSGIDSIEITHTAHSRKGFALGAVVAAEWIIDKKGVFNMTDMINDTNLKL
ncbi:4-hydroxy-tetrahydrodipicolinate reductase [Flavobacteriaceae bacterium]|nr:4-hydroxy-tetrahydrodipicolinate reductase [Flavobacteriaceae bacterium]